MSTLVYDSPGIKPWHDCPPCPSCGARVGTPAREAEPGRWYGPADATLVCPACGCGWTGTAADVEQADRALAAWHAIDGGAR